VGGALALIEDLKAIAAGARVIEGKAVGCG
jgi:hypothetical protein